MAVLAPAIIDVRPADKTLGLATWLRGIGVRQVRLVCGLIMFSYIFSHFFNHALGNLSYDTMEAWLRFHVWWWRIPVVNFALYAAATTHLSLGLWALYQRRHFRYTVIEITQLLLGLSIPLLIASHLGVMRLGGLLFGRGPPHYSGVLFAYWANNPYMVGVQFLLLTVAWTHACIGLYFWLRLKPFFKWAAPFLLAIAVLLPPLAMTGAHHGAHEVLQLASQPQWRAEHINPTPLAQRSVIDEITLFYFPILYGATLALVFTARGVRAMLESRRGSITVSYPDRRVRVPKGLSVLEASLRYNVPHASVCGGRARCSTCRIRVIGDCTALPEPSPREAFVLGRVGTSDPSIRLACQLRPAADLSFFQLFMPHTMSANSHASQPSKIGQERYLVSLFVDMRGSTQLAEKRLPFDTVFIVNRFLGAVSQAVIDNGGQPNQFVGDGMLALFGLATGQRNACRQALKAAAAIAANVEELNQFLSHDLREPIRFGIGIHGGEVIVGDIGYRDHMVFTALGDAVNVAARLQDMTKTLACEAIVSEEVRVTADFVADDLPQQEVAIRGRAEPMIVRIVANAGALSAMVDGQAVAAA